MSKRHLILACLLIVSMAACNAASYKPKPLVYYGDTLEWNWDWKRTQCGTLDITANIIEVSGIACSRVTPGYIWMQSDEVEKYIIATDEVGEKRACKLKMSKTIGWDWEDMSGGSEYKLYLNLPDPKPNLHNDPRYSIRLANENCWDETTGYNYLTTVTVE